ncbi:interferon-induced protein 44-like isoform X1 [Boleophthalmus pectinirostris]|uniref:interferon-induced protein 44-like isoform X1 n=2 Tax=Boleophthalmus pectinirostris TaxID=150288 RepID=UPI00242A60E4|nr:interferon-induced protein 44-like isoform X1 [Boleophthalmus pectinirostris]
MNSNLTRVQQRALCRELGGGVKLKLLFKASIHGFTGAAFHQRCDGRGPSISVGYNSSGYVFGGYTNVSFTQAGNYVNDPKAFLFTFKGDALLKYPTTNSGYAVKMINNTGPYFAESLILMNGGANVVYTNSGKYYTAISPAEMHGNDLQLIECEVYQVEENMELEKPWRPMVWLSDRRLELMDTVSSYKPLCSSVSKVRVLLMGPVGAGKSSFFNSINSVFKGHVTIQAMAGSSATSVTTQFRTYSVKAGREGKPLPIILCDTMGLEDSTGAGLDIDDITSILKGHMPNCYQFNASAPLHSETHGYRSSPELKDKIHCLVFVLDGCKISIMPDKLEAKLAAVRRKANLLGIPQLALVTKVDEACPIVKEDLTSVYKSPYIKDLLQEASARLGLPLSCVLPLKNYSEELELELPVDILVLSALQQILRFADTYFEELDDRLSNSEVK